MGASKFGGATARAVQWHVANLEYGCATALRNVSLQWWDQDDQHGMAGDHVVITSGYDKLIDGLAEGMIPHPESFFPPPAAFVVQQHESGEPPGLVPRTAPGLQPQPAALRGAPPPAPIPTA